MTTSPPSSLENLFTPGLVAAQQPQWPGGVDGTQVKKAVAELRSFPPLVFAGECDDLKAKIAEAAAGRAFWLQGGDCAETFAAATADSIRNGSCLAVLLQPSSGQSWSYGWAICQAAFE